MSEDPDLEVRPRPADSPRPRPHSRPRPPRFGPFVTIAVAILLLFGAASRMGKPADTAALFNIDQSAGERLRLEEVRRANEEERLRTFLAIGAAPVRGEAPAVAMALEENPAPPYRGEFDLGAQRRANEEARLAGEESRRANEERAGGRAMVSLAVPVTAVAAGTEGVSAAGQASPSPAPRTAHDPIPEAAPAARPPAGARAYVVSDGDTWVKIAKATLGDAKRWQDIQAANPPAKDGLRVGMRLAIPE